MTSVAVNSGHAKPAQPLGPASIAKAGPLIALTSGFHFTFGGQLFIADVLSAVLAGLSLAMLSIPALLRTKAARWLLPAVGAWLIAQIVSDLVNNTARHDYLRGWANIVFFGAALLAVAVSIGCDAALQRRFMVWLGIGGVLGYAVQPSLYAQGDPWKFGLGVPCTYVAIGALSYCWPKHRNWAVLGLLCIGILHLSLAFRSEGLVSIVAALLLLAAAPRRTRRRASVVATALALLAGIIGVAVASYGYTTLARDGTLGSTAAVKYQMEAGTGLPLIFAGRGEILLSSKAVAASPLLGHGSWARDDQLAREAATLRQRGITIDYDPSDPSLIPTHSFLLQAWVQSGVVGAGFWLLALLLVLAAIAFTVSDYATPNAPMVLFLGCQMVWDIWFSPFGANRRVDVAAALLILATSCTNRSVASRLATTSQDVAR